MKNVSTSQSRYTTQRIVFALLTLMVLPVLYDRFGTPPGASTDPCRDVGS